jgi:hypothetical protein
MPKRKTRQDPPAQRDYERYNPFDAQAAMWPQNTTAQTTIDRFNTDHDPFILMCKEAIRDPERHSEWTQLLVARERERIVKKQPCQLSEAAKKYKHELIAVHHVLRAPPPADPDEVPPPPPDPDEPDEVVEHPNILDLYTTAVDKMRRMPRGHHAFDLSAVQIEQVLDYCNEALRAKNAQALSGDARQAIHELHTSHVLALQERLRILDRYTFPLKLKKQFRC